MGTARGAARRRGAGGRTAHSTAPWPCPRSVLPAPFEAPTPPPRCPTAPRGITAQRAVRAPFNGCAPRAAGARDPRPARGAQIQRRAPVTLSNK